MHKKRSQGGIYLQVLEKGLEFGDERREIPEEAYTREVGIYQSDTVQYFTLLELEGLVRWGGN